MSSVSLKIMIQRRHSQFILWVQIEVKVVKMAGFPITSIY